MQLNEIDYRSINIGDKLILNLIAILFPVNSVLASASLIVSADSVDQDAS
jgi:hypothetical protein